MDFPHPIRTWQDQLESLHNRSGLWWGNSDYPFTSLVAFLMGYQCGFGAAQAGSRISPQDLLPHDFHRFVTERFERHFPDGGKGWQSFIVEHTHSEKEAFELFFQLREEYERQQNRNG